MARGIMGDDGPSLFMFIAVVLMWGAFQKWFNNTTEAVKDGLGIGHNTAGPMQEQTSADIKRSEDVVKGIVPTWSALPKGKPFYQSIADKMWREMNSSMNIDEAALIAMVKGLSKNELLAVAKAFGVKENAHFGLTAWSGNIFEAMDVAFEGMFKKSELAQMKAIWAPTKLW